MKLISLGLAVVVIVLDHITKAAVLDTFANRVPFIEVTSFFNLVLAHNRGVSFGMFSDGSALNVIVLSLLATAIVALLLAWLWRAKSRLVVYGIGLVVGGAIGNVIDRVIRGAVVDFLDVHLGDWHWPAFNVADSAICIGVAFLVLDGLRGKRDALN